MFLKSSNFIKKMVWMDGRTDRLTNLAVVIIGHSWETMHIDVGQVKLKVGSWCGSDSPAQQVCGWGLRVAGGLKAGLGQGLHAEAHEELSTSHGRVSVSQRWPPAAHRLARTQQREHTGECKGEEGSLRGALDIIQSNVLKGRQLDGWWTNRP